jgi:hypothetical protein
MARSGILILPTKYLFHTRRPSEWYFPFGLSPTKVYIFLDSPMRATYPPHLILLDLICLMMLGMSTKHEAPDCAGSSILK